MKTNKEKVKKIWEDHKKEIIIGSAAFVGGVVITVVVGKRLYGVDGLKLAKEMNTFGPDVKTGRTMIQDIDAAMIGSNHADVFVNGKEYGIKAAGERFINWYADNGYDLDKTKVTGLVAFIEK